MQDEGTQAEFFYPTINRNEKGVELGIREFTGSRLKEVEEFYSDNAKEFKSVSRTLGKPNSNSEVSSN